MKRAAIICTAIALAGCVADQSGTADLNRTKADSMVGLPEEEVMRRLGRPQNRGASALSYVTLRQEPVQRTGFATTSLSGENTSSGVRVGRTTLRCTWIFAVDTGGRVTGWRNQGDLCSSL